MSKPLRIRFGRGYGTPYGAMRATAAAACRISAERLLQQIVDHAGIGLAAHRLHRLADEETEQLVLAAAIFGDLIGIGGHYSGDHCVDRAGVRGLLHATILDDLRGI